MIISPEFIVLYKRTLNVFCLAVILLFVFTAYAFSGTIQIKGRLGKIPVCPSVEYLETSDKNLGINDVRGEKFRDRWVSSSSQALGFGFTDKVYWVRFKVENRNDSDIEFLLEQSYPLMTLIRLYIFDDKKIKPDLIEVGEDRPFAERPYENRKFIFPLRIKPHSTQMYYMSFETVGAMNIILQIWDPILFSRESSDEYLLFFLFYAIISIMIIYNFFIFIFIRRMQYLYYVLLILSYLLLMMSLNGTAYQFLWPNFPLFAKLTRPLFNILIQIFGGLFCIELVELRKNINGRSRYRQIIYKGIFIFYAVSLGTSLLYFLISKTLINVVPAFFTGLFLALILVMGIVLIIKERNRSAIFGLSAASAIILGGIAFILKTFGIIPTTFFSEWSIYIGSVGMIVIFSYALADRINIMSAEMKKAEEKYRHLVESSDDIIFSMDGEMNFLSVNRAMTKHLGFLEKDILGQNFLDFIHDMKYKSKQISREIIREYINDLKISKGSVSFRTDFKLKYSNAPMELSVKIDYSETSGREEKFFGKASLSTDDIILKYMKLERHIYEAENYLNNAEFLSQRLTRNLGNLLNNDVISEIRNSLREVLINAIEHGNLNIQFNEKTRAIKEGNYLKYIQERQKDECNRNKKIYVDYIITDDKAVYNISDEGRGFDHQTMLRNILEKSRVELISHGRGLLMVYSVFDEVRFNEEGNSVTLVKTFNKKREAVHGAAN